MHAPSCHTGAPSTQYTTEYHILVVLEEHLLLYPLSANRHAGLAHKYVS